MMTLSATSQGFTRRQLFDLIPGYDAANPRSRARQFDRDLDQLAEAGITISQSADPYEPGTVRYRIPEGGQQALAVTAEERAVLAAALAAWDASASGSIGGRVRAKLLSMGIEPEVMISGRTTLSTAPALTSLLAAALERRTVGFDYRGGQDDAPRPRLIDPWLVGVVDAIPYVYGYDHDRAAPRLFRLSRIANAPRVIRAASIPVPAGLNLDEIVHRARSAPISGPAQLRIHPFKALPLRDRAGAAPEQTSVATELSGDALHRAALREHAWVRIAAPADAADRLLNSLQRIEQMHSGAPSIDPDRAIPVPAGLNLDEIVHRARSAPISGPAQLRIHPFKALPLRDRAGAAPEQTSVATELSGDALHRAALREHAWVRIAAPADAADRLLNSLQRIEQMHSGAPSIDPDRAQQAPQRRQRSVRALASGSTDVARLVAIAAYAQQHPEADAVALAARLGISQQDLVRDLNLLMMVGDYSSGVSAFVDTSVEDGDVFIANAESLSTPLQLTPLDAAALLLGLDTIDADELALDPAALRSLRTRLEAIAGRVGNPPGHDAQTRPRKERTPEERAEHDGDETLEAAEHPGRAAHNAAVITAALDAGESVIIRYARPDQDFTTVRSIRPHRIDIAHGHVYVTAHCALSGGERRFRTDRIIRAWPGMDPSAPTPMTSLPERAADPAAEATPAAQAVLRLAPGALWIADAFHGSHLFDDPTGEGDAVAVITTSALPALISAVIEADGAAEALGPPPLRHAVRQAVLAARRDQERYG